MLKPFWRVKSEHARYGLTAFGIQSTACFVTIITVGFLLRLSTVVWAVGARCMEADQFWARPSGIDWPLGGAFFLVIFLLFVWNSALVLNNSACGKKELALPVINFIAIIALLVVFVPGYKTAQIRYDDREASYGRWLVSNRPELSYLGDSCKAARAFLGEWTVIEKSLHPGSAEFPFSSIEFHQSLTYRAVDSESGELITDEWNPPALNVLYAEEYRDIGSIYVPDRAGYGDWHFQLRGNHLTLVSAYDYEWVEPSKVRLKRSE